MTNLREDAEFVLRRERHYAHLHSVLILSPVAEQPGPAILRRLEHEYALAPELDSDWAIRPLAIAHWDHQTVLVLEDPGGDPLDPHLGSPLELAHFLPLAIGIAVAVGHVHAAGLIHKDIRPANIFAEPGGKVRLTGFGIASRRQRPDPDSREIIAGTLAYIAPEQTGRMSRSIDSRSDLYSLGVTLYQMLTGTLPFDAADPLEWIHCHVAGVPTPPAQRTPLPDPLSNIVMKLLAKTPETRYQTARGLEADLRHCLADWEAHGRIDPFPLGKHDVSDRLRLPGRLYGRDAATREMLTTFNRSATDGTAALLLVSGDSGVGKSSVVNELHKALAARCLFAAGKIDQYKRDIPYATLAQAARSLVQQLLGKREAEISSWRHALLSELGSNGQLMINLVPELEFVIGPQPPVPDLPPQETPNRFNSVFQRFLGVFARAEHPLVLFLDDLQWLGAATLKLIEYLMTEPETRHLMVIGAYRDNEVDASHPLMRTVDAIRKAGSRVEECVLGPLAVDDVVALIADGLHCRRRVARPLARLVHDKTLGNPFFVIQFISSLEEEGLLAFDPATADWRWDMAKVRAKGHTDNVVQLLVAKLARLPTPTLDVLKLAACLGTSAELCTLAALSEESEETTLSALWQAEQAGLVTRLETGYKFLHDRVRETAYSLIPENERAALHVRIGRLLWSGATNDVHAKIFEIVNQLNRGADLIASLEERRRVAELNFIAGKLSRQSAAYAAALIYLTTGCALLPEDGARWDELRFALEYHRAECEFLSGALIAADARLELLSRHTGSRLDLAAVTVLRIQLYQTQGRNDRAIEVCLEHFQQVGVPWTANPTKADLLGEYGQLWQRLDNRPIEALADLPAMTDREQRATLDVLTTVSAPALLTDSNLFRLVICRMVNLSLQHGNSDGSCLAYVYLNLILREDFNDFQAGYRFGQLGVALADRGLDRFKTRILLGFGNTCSPWIEHFRVGLPWIERAYATAQETGDLVFGLYSHLLSVPHRLVLDIPLKDVQDVAEQVLHLARKLRFTQAVAWATVQLLFIRALRGLTGALASFGDDEFDEQQFEHELATDPRLRPPSCWYWIRKLQVFVYAGDFAAAVAAANKAQALLWTSLTPFEQTEFHFYAALARAAFFDRASAGERPALRAAIAADAEWLGTMVKHNPASFENRSLLVAAEIARLEGRQTDAECLYEQAIGGARENGFVQIEALAYEVAARFYADRGRASIADALMGKARSCYNRWGALGKLRHLDRSRPQHHDEPFPPTPTATINTPLAQLDVETLFKAAQAVSSQIMLDKLIETLLVIGMEHAGAARGLLLLLRNDQPRVAAEAVTSRDKIEVTLRAPDMPHSDFPESVLRYVVRTRATLVLDDAAAASIFADDEYVRRHQLRSMLCLPLVKQAKLVGLLYLEHRLLSHVFTTQRVVLLNLLAAQAAISLENAHLYADLRDREDRIRKLVDSNLIGIFFWTMNGKITDVNDAFLAIIGYSRADFREGRLQWDAIASPEYNAVDEQMKILTRATGDTPSYEKEFIRKDGSRVSVFVGGALLEDSREKGVSFVLDLTERKRAERERDARHVAEAANRAKSEFLATMSHELRTPLNGILGYAQILQADRELSPRQHQGVTVIRQSGEHLLKLVDDILDLAKIEAARVELNPVVVHLPYFLHAIAEVVSVRLKEKTLDIICDVDPTLPGVVRLDERRLRQVLLNLLGNAVKFTDRGQVKLQVRSLPTGRVRFDVTDTGTGIPGDKLESVFEPFEQLDEARRRFGGTGLGLSISRQLVRLMGGELRVESTPGEGSAFWFDLDLPVAQIGSAAAAQPSGVVTGYNGPRKTVLVVDDVPANRAILLDLLSDLGFSAIEAVNGREGLEKAAAFRPDLILMDTVMPEIDGLEATRRLRELAGLKDIPVVMVSARATGTDAAQSLAAGANAFLSKPIDVNALIAQIASLLNLDCVRAEAVANAD